MMEYVEEELNVYIGSMMQLLNKLNYKQNSNINDGKIEIIISYLYILLFFFFFFFFFFFII